MSFISEGSPASDHRRAMRGSVSQCAKECKLFVDHMESSLDSLEQQMALCKELAPMMDDSVKLNALVKEGLPDVLIGILEKHGQSQDLTRLVVTLLAQIAAKGDAYTIGEEGGLELLIGILQRWATEPQIILPTLHLLGIVAGSEGKHERAFLDANGIETTLEITKAHPGNIIIHAASLTLCANATAAIHPPLASSVTTSSTTPHPPQLSEAVSLMLVRFALQALKETEIPVLLAAMSLTLNLSAMETSPLQLHEFGVAEALIAVLKRFAGHLPLLSLVAQVVAQLAAHESLRQALGEQGIVEALFNLLMKERVHPTKDEVGVLRTMLLALASLCINNTPNQESLLQLGGVHYAMNLLSKLQSQSVFEPVHSAVIKLLSAMSTHNLQIQSLIITGPTGNGVATLVQGMRGNTASAKLIGGYAGLFVNLSADSGNHRLLGSQPLLLCLEALEKHMRDKPVALRLLYAIQNMVCYGGNYIALAESSLLKVLVDVLDLQRDDLDYASLLAKSFLHLSMDSNHMEEPLIKSGIAAVIISAIRRHLGNSELLLSYYKVLVNLCISETSQMAMLHEGGMDLMLQTLRGHPKNVELQGAVISLMSNLMKTGVSLKVRGFLFASDEVVATILRVALQNSQHHGLMKQLAWLIKQVSARVNKEAHLVIMADMGLTEALEEMISHHPDDLTLAQHVCITLANVSDSPEGASLLQEDGAPHVIFHLMQRWPESEEVQENGAAFIGNLAPAHHAVLHASSALEVLLHAIAKHTSPFVVAEAMNAVAKMCRTESGTTDWGYLAQYGGALAGEALGNAMSVAFRSASMSPSKAHHAVVDRTSMNTPGIDATHLMAITASAMAVISRPEAEALTKKGADAPVEGGAAAVKEPDSAPVGQRPTDTDTRFPRLLPISHLATPSSPPVENLRLGRHSSSGPMADIVKARVQASRTTPHRKSKYEPLELSAPQPQKCNHCEVAIQRGLTATIVQCLVQWQYAHGDDMIIYNLCLTLFHLTTQLRFDAKLDEVLLTAGIVTALLNTMITNSHHLMILVFCCKALAVLCRHSADARLEANQSDGLMQLIWNCMLSHSKAYEVQHVGCLLLGNLCLLQQNRRALLAMDGLQLILASSAESNGPQDELAIARGWVLAQLSLEGYAVQAQIRQAQEKTTILWASQSTPGWVLDEEQTEICQQVVRQWPRMTADIEEEEEVTRGEAEKQLEGQHLQLLVLALEKKQKVIKKSITMSREEYERLLLEQYDHQSMLSEQLREQRQRIKWMEDELLLQQEEHKQSLQKVDNLCSELNQLMAWDSRKSCHAGAQTDLLMRTINNEQRRLAEAEADLADLVNQLEMRDPQHVDVQTDLHKSYMLTVDAKWEEVHRLSAEVQQREEQIAVTQKELSDQAEALAQREAAVLAREENMAKAEADDMLRKEEICEAEKVLHSRWAEVQRVESELHRQEEEAFTKENDLQERFTVLAIKESALEVLLQELVDREMAVAQKETCLGAVETREQQVTLREQKMTLKEQMEGTLEERENFVTAREKNVSEKETAMTVWELAVLQREELAKKQDEVLESRHQRCLQQMKQIQMQRTIVESLALGVAEREQRLTQVDGMICQRENLLTKWWQSIDSQAMELEARAKLLEDREAAVESREHAMETRELEGEQREAAMQVREMEGDERTLRQEERQAMQDKRHAEQDEREEILTAIAQDNQEKLVQVTQKEGQQRAKERELMRREAELDELDKTLRQLRQTLETRKAELLVKEQDITEAQQALKIQEEHLQQTEAQQECREQLLNERESQLDCRDQQVQDKEEACEKKLEAFAMRQRQFFKREKTFKLQEEDVAKREATLLVWMKEMEFREKEIEATEHSTMPRLHATNNDKVRRKFNESLMSVQLRLMKENYVMEKDRKLRKGRELPAVVARGWDMVDDILDDSEVRATEKSVVQQWKIFRKMLAHLRSSPEAADTPLSAHDLDQVREVEQKDAVLREELSFLAAIEDNPLEHRDEWGTLETLMKEVDRWWKTVHRQLLQHKLRTLQERKVHLDRGVSILEDKVNEHFILLQTLRPSPGGLDSTPPASRTKGPWHGRPRTALAAFGTRQRSATPGHTPSRPLTALAKTSAGIPRRFPSKVFSVTHGPRAEHPLGKSPLPTKGPKKHSVNRSELEAQADALLEETSTPEVAEAPNSEVAEAQDAASEDAPNGSLEDGEDVRSGDDHTSHSSRSPHHKTTSDPSSSSSESDDTDKSEVEGSSDDASEND